MTRDQLIEHLNLTPALLPFTPWWLRWWFLLPVSVVCCAMVVYVVYRIWSRAPQPVRLTPAQQVVAECLAIDAALSEDLLSGSSACVRISGAVKVYLSAVYAQPLVSLTDDQVVDHVRSMHKKGLVDTEFYGILELMLEDFYAVKFADQAVEVPALRERIQQLIGCIKLAAHQE